MVNVNQNLLVLPLCLDCMLLLPGGNLFYLFILFIIYFQTSMLLATVYVGGFANVYLSIKRSPERNGEERSPDKSR